MICKESDLLIVPMRLVTRVEGRGKHIICSENKTSVALEMTENMANEFERIALQAMKHKRCKLLCIMSTNIIEENKKQKKGKENNKDGKTDTFDFLVFTHINSKSRTGKYRVEHKTSWKKLKTKKESVK